MNLFSIKNYFYQLAPNKKNYRLVSMIVWSNINSININRVGYNKEKESLYIDFVGSETDTVLLQVPEALYSTFIEAKSADKFYDQFVKDYFDVAVFHTVNAKENYRHLPRIQE